MHIKYVYTFVSDLMRDYHYYVYKIKSPEIIIKKKKLGNLYSNPLNLTKNYVLNKLRAKPIQIDYDTPRRHVFITILIQQRLLFSVFLIDSFLTF